MTVSSDLPEETKTVLLLLPPTSLLLLLILVRWISLKCELAWNQMIGLVSHLFGLYLCRDNQKNISAPIRGC